MSFKLFKNSKILAPLKCGTRYIEKCLNESGEFMSVFDIKSNLYIKNTDTIIVRPPFEHMTSALFTELNHHIYGNDESVNIEQLELILNSFIHTECDKHTESNYPHWCKDVYDNLYWYWRRNYKNIDIVELKNLSEFLISKNIDVVSYSADNYNFKNVFYLDDNNLKHVFYKQDELLLFVKMNYEDIWNELLEQVEYSEIYYNALINRTLLEIKLI
jgi:hypothetical protein